METNPLLQDPLTKNSRTERRSLLIVCAVSFAVVRTNLVITKAFGMEFTPIDQKSLRCVLISLVVYFLFAFIFSAASDFTAWSEAFNTMKCNRFEDRRKTAEDEDVSAPIERRAPPDIEKEIQRDEAPVLESLYRLRSRYIPVAFQLRAFFTFAIPLLIGIGALVVLVCFSYATPIVVPHP